MQLTALVDAANCTQVFFQYNTSKIGYEITVLPLTQEILHKLYLHSSDLIKEACNRFQKLVTV